MNELTREKFLNDKEYAALLQTLAHQRTLDERNALLIDVAMNTGARASEILALQYSDFSEDGVHITGTKKSRNRIVPIPDEILTRVLMRARTENDSQLVFPISYQRLVQIWRQYTPNPNKTFHSLRHTFAVHLYKRHKDLKLVQLALGHRSPTNTAIYADFFYSQSELKRLLLG